MSSLPHPTAPLTGFLNLIADNFSDHPVVLFHTTGTHGIRPTEFSPRTQLCNLVESKTSNVCIVFTDTNTRPAPKNLFTMHVRGHVGSDNTAATGFSVRVRSHSELVLPNAEGRYSPEHLTLFTKQCLSFHHSRAY